MKTRFILSVIFILSSMLCALSQTPQGFTYQAIARNASGDAISNQSLPVRLTIQSDSLGGTTFWQELHSSVTTNSFGLFTVIVGKGTRQASSTVPTFSDIDWKVIPKFIKTEVYYNSEWKNMGSSRLWSVPYSMVASNLSGPVGKLDVKGTTTSLEEALFEVKNNIGQTIFAVYNEGVRIYVDDGAKGTKGGFAIGGFGDKALSQEYFRVTRDSTRVYVNKSAKGTKGGFAIGGFDSKGIDNFLNLTPSNYFIGHRSGVSISTGLYNSFIGYETGVSTTTGSGNVVLGYQSGYLNQTGNSNVFMGYKAGYSTTLSYNTFIGFQAGLSNTTGQYNAFMGYN
ncbi:MAG TPA: hypothetical protein PK064_11790, partial [Bacteroidales bacterium]|nr:hypothetical protein [Bacteroidales bacterium]